MEKEVVIMQARFDSRLQQLRKEGGFTQAKLARQMDKADSTVRMWELGKNQPDHDSLIRLARIFDVSVDYLLGNSDSRHNTARLTAAPRPALNTLLQLLQDVPDEDLEAILRIVRGYLGK